MVPGAAAALFVNHFPEVLKQVERVGRGFAANEQERERGLAILMGVEQLRMAAGFEDGRIQMVEPLTVEPVSSDWVDVEEGARVLGVGARQMTNLCADDEDLVAEKVRGRWRIDRMSLLVAAASRGRRVS